MSIIKIDYLRKSYGSKTILNDFSFELKKGSFTVISGPSGSGKSTILNIIGLLESYDKGDVEWFGQKNIKPYSKKASLLLRNKIGYLFQNYALVDNETVKYNLQIPLECIKVSDKEAIIDGTLRDVGLANYQDKKIYTCSGGEQQRIAIARLMIKPCELILADEPTGSLDEENKMMVYQLLRKLQEKGKTILMVTHDPELIALADDVVSLSPIG